MVQHRSTADSQEGRYTRDHILFEGSDFEGWKAYIEGQLAQKKLLNQARAKKARVFQSPRGKEALSYVLKHVDECIRQRIDLDQVHNMPQLFLKLNDQSKSFDLFGLPAELRNQIYSLAFQTQREQDIYVPHTRYTGPSVPELPALLRTRGQIPTEAASVYFAESTFVLYLGCDHFLDNDQRHEVTQHIEEWLNTHVKENNKQHIRRLRIEIEHGMGPGRGRDTRSVTFTASEAGELGFQLTPGLGNLEQIFAKAIGEVNHSSERRGNQSFGDYEEEDASGCRV